MNHRRAPSEAQAVEKAFTILRRELSPAEYVAFLRAMTPRFKDSARELQKLTKGRTVEGIFKEFKSKPNRYL